MRTWKSDDNISVMCANGVIRKTHKVRLLHITKEYKVCTGVTVPCEVFSQERN